jgi:Zn-dependent protease
MTLSSDDADRLEIIGRVREALTGLMDVERYTWDAGGRLTLYGNVSGDAGAYRTIRARLEPLGFTPFLRRGVDGGSELLAVPVVITRGPQRRLLPLILFLATALSTLVTGALNQIPECVGDTAGMLRLLGQVLSSPAALLAGLPFALTLLGILLAHEMGHYVMGRIRQAPVSLPYFIPMPPFISFTGTMGAVIVQREPMEDRRTILEVGIAGPLAGLVVAIPLLLYGLSTSQVGPLPAAPEGCAIVQEGNSILYAGAKLLVFGQMLPAGDVDVWLSPVAFGAWIGLLVTMLNLLPVGQLDGGHIAYALLGRTADQLAYGMIGLCFAVGLIIPEAQVWLIWGVLGLLIGPRHPPPLNDIARLGRGHMALAIFGLVVFILLLMPVPLRTVGA